MKAWPEIIALSLILALAAYLRLAHLDYAQMRADDANLWAIVVSLIQEPRILTRGTLSSFGPPNGPFQAYILLLAAPFTVEPISAYVVVASLNIVTVLACWAFSRAYFGRQVALVAALIFAVNPWAVIFSRRLWGNDMTALFTVLLIWSLCNLITKGRRRDSFMPFLWLSILVQTYLGALVNLATLALGLAFGSRRLRFPWLVLGLTVFTLITGPYAADASLSLLDPFRQLTVQPNGPATADAASLRFVFHAVGNEGYQAFANQAGGVYDTSVGLPFALSLFLEGLLAAGLALALLRMIRALQRRDYAATAP